MSWNINKCSKRKRIGGVFLDVSTRLKKAKARLELIQSLDIEEKLKKEIVEDLEKQIRILKETEKVNLIRNI